MRVNLRAKRRIGTMHHSSDGASGPDLGSGRSEVPVVLVAPTELKVANRMEFGEKIAQAAIGSKHVIVDLCSCHSIDSAALGVLVRAHRRLIEKGGTLTFMRCGNEIRELFALTRMSGFLNVREDDDIDPRIT